MQVIKRDSVLWKYLSDEVKNLVRDGETLLDFIGRHHQKEDISDYSFLVFPFAKAYEGFMKQLFLDLKEITVDEYYGDEIRIGRLLSPRYKKGKRNVFKKKCGDKSGGELAVVLWKVWKRGRNLVFHYFPHNFRKISYEEAGDIVNDFVQAMSLAVGRCGVKRPS